MTNFNLRRIYCREKVGYRVALTTPLGCYKLATTEFSIQSENNCAKRKLCRRILVVKLKMVRTWVRKTDSRNWDDAKMIAAMHAVREEHMSCNMAATTYEIPEATLRRYLKTEPEKLPVHGGRFRKVFSEEQLEQLKTYLTEIDRRLFGLTKIQCRKLVFQFAEACGLNHPFNRDTQMAGEDWVSGFMKTFNFSMRAPEATSIGRTIGFNPVQVNKFFDLLKEVRVKYEFSSSQIFNADESGLSTVPTKLPKIISPKGTKRVSKVVSAERGKNVTVVCSASATGVYVPPFLIFPRKRMRPELLDHLPPGSEGHASETGWMNSELFVSYLQHFTNHVKPSENMLVLLLVDSHASHVSLPAINFCREHHIVMVEFPPHTTHRLQPLDVSFFGPLKTFYSQACDNFMVSHPGQPITDRNIGQLFGTAYLKAATVANAIKGFEACGIEPYNPHIFAEEDFAPSATTERDLTQSGTSHDEPTLVCNGPQEVAVENDHPTQTNIPQPETSQQKDQPETVHAQAEAPARGSNWKENITVKTSIPAKAQVTLNYIKPLPRANRSMKRKRPVVTASVLTSTPVKDILVEKEQEKENKLKKKEERDAKTAAKKLFQKTKESQENTETIMCPGCEEEFIDPPNEDWVKCGACGQWWHEDCSSYEGCGKFKCDYC